MENGGKWYDSLNVIKTCSKYKVSILQCPQFLFLLMGIIIIAAILVTYEVTKTYGEPEIAALIVLAVSVIIFSIGQIVINSFEKIIASSLAKSEFISIVSHQLRSPLSAIKWQVNILTTENTSETISENIKNYLGTIYKENEKMIRSVNDLLEVNRIEDGDIVLIPENFYLTALTEKVVDEYQKSANINSINIFLKASPNLPPVYADPTRIKMVLEHLLDNAIRYSFKNGNVNINIEEIEANLIWKVSDEGVGIPHEDRKRVFEKFFRSKSTARYKTSGSGVGLFIAKSIVKLSGGSMGFSSSENKGSTFWFSLPVAVKLSVKKMNL